MAASEYGPFDVAIVGAGPAGSALARRLAGGGRRVALLERSRYEQPRIGETLSPQVQPELRALGVWPAFLALEPLPSWGITSVWGEPAAQVHSHLASPWGSGWHIDRVAFDRLLANAAGHAGAFVLEGAEVRSPWFDGRRWQLCAGPSRLEARVLVDASGRSARLARQLGAQRLVLDPLVGIAAVWQGVSEAERHHLLVESVASGWWYSAPLPGGGASRSMVTMLMTDADRCARGRLQLAAEWIGALSQAPQTHGRVASASIARSPQVHLAQSQRLLRPGKSPGPWLAVGDAALAVDPLSGSGILRALQQAAQAAQVIDAVLDQPRDAEALVAAHECSMDDAFSRYLWERSAQYDAEERFETPFWTRRRGLRGSLARPAGIEPAT